MRFLLYRRRSLKSPLILAYLAIASKALIEAKILQRYAMISAPAASVEEPPYREPELYFYQGEFIRKVAAPDFAHGFSMTNSVSSHTGSGNSKAQVAAARLQCASAPVSSYPGLALSPTALRLLHPLRIFFETSTKGGSGPRF